MSGTFARWPWWARNTLKSSQFARALSHRNPGGAPLPTCAGSAPRRARGADPARGVRRPRFFGPRGPTAQASRIRLTGRGRRARGGGRSGCAPNAGTKRHSPLAAGRNRARRGRNHARRGGNRRSKRRRLRPIPTSRPRGAPVVAPGVPLSGFPVGRSPRGNAGGPRDEGARPGARPGGGGPARAGPPPRIALGRAPRGASPVGRPGRGLPIARRGPRAHRGKIRAPAAADRAARATARRPRGATRARPARAAEVFVDGVGNSRRLNV